MDTSRIWAIFDRKEYDQSPTVKETRSERITRCHLLVILLYLECLDERCTAHIRCYATYWRPRVMLEADGYFPIWLEEMSGNYELEGRPYRMLLPSLTSPMRLALFAIAATLHRTMQYPRRSGSIPRLFLVAVFGSCVHAVLKTVTVDIPTCIDAWSRPASPLKALV